MSTFSQAVQTTNYSLILLYCLYSNIMVNLLTGTPLKDTMFLINTGFGLLHLLLVGTSLAHRHSIKRHNVFDKHWLRIITFITSRHFTA